MMMMTRGTLELVILIIMEGKNQNIVTVTERNPPWTLARKSSDVENNFQ